MSKLSKHQRIHNAIGSQKVEEMKGRHAYLHGIGYGREEYNIFWLRSEHTTWGHGFGRMVGFDEMAYGHGPFYDKSIARRLTRNAMANADFHSGHDPRSTYRSAAHVLSSGVVEVAEDGMSARSFYMTPGTMTGSIGGDGTTREGGWLNERYGSDFVFHDGHWWWFHEQVIPDFGDTYDIGNWAHKRYVRVKNGNMNMTGPDLPAGPGAGGPGGQGGPGGPGGPGGQGGPGGAGGAAPKMGGPDRLTDDEELCTDNSIVHIPHDLVPPPVPYKTLDDDNTYSVGHNEIGTVKPESKSYGGNVDGWDV